MKVETDAVLVVFWRCEKMVLRWHWPVDRSICHKEVATSMSKLFTQQSNPRNVNRKSDAILLRLSSRHYWTSDWS